MSTPAYPSFFVAAGQPAFTTAAPVAGFVPEFPFGESRPDALLITQRFWQTRADYLRPASNAQNCSAYPTARFCEDLNFRDLGHGLVEWTRLWATLPAERQEYETYAFRYPGIFDQRDPFSVTQISTLTYNYYLIGPGGSHATPDLIPNPGVFYYIQDYLDTDTTPTLATYEAQTTLNVEISVRRWRGNIYERMIRTVPRL